jgi:RNA polymerase sigma factor (sigma-70 family)
MTTPRADSTLPGLHRLVGRLRDAAATDRELLRRFAEGPDEAAFEAVVRRHAALVLATARRVLGNAHDAEDVCQAAFLILAKKAASQRWQPSVASWLHRTAHHLALKARTAAHRRTRREGRTAPRTPPNPLAEMTGQELLAVLDAELLALPESLRAPLVLCYLQGATRDEAAQRLGCPLSTLKKRLERGRERLHAALTRRDLSLSAVLLGGLLPQPSATASGALVSATARAALALAAGQSLDGVISAQVRQLVNGGLGVMSGKTLKVTLAALLVGGLLSTVGALASGAGDDKPPPPKERAATPEPQSKPAAARTLRITVLDPQGKPLAGADIHAGVWTDEKGFKANRDYKTDAAGVAVVELPKSFTILRLWASKKPFVTLFANWERGEVASGKVPGQYTFRLESPVSAGGRVVDEGGKPIAGAQVEVSLLDNLKPAQSDSRVRYNNWLAERSEPAITDAEGRWHIDNVPNHPSVELYLLVTHPDYVTVEDWWQLRKANDLTTAKLLQRTAVVKLKRGVIVRGQVTDPAGKPIPQAIVVAGDDPYGTHMPSKFATDAEGRYRLPALPPGLTTLTAMAPGCAPQMRKVDVRAGLPPQDFHLRPGKTIRLRVVDAAGKPVPGASVYLLEWKGSKSIQTNHNPNHPKLPSTKIPRATNTQGVWEWTFAPNDGSVKLQIGKRGFAFSELEVAGGAPERTVTLKANYRITGRVVDDVTGQPLPAFAMIPLNVFGKDYFAPERYHAVAGKNGRLDYVETCTDHPMRIRIEAMGYRTQDGPEFRVGDGATRTQNFRLRPSKPITGVVRDAGGQPVAKAEVWIATPSQETSLLTEVNNHRTITDASGRFAFPDPGEPWAVFARANAGTAIAEGTADSHDAGTLTLRPWASVRGQFRDGQRPVQDATIFLQVIRLSSLHHPRLDLSLQTHTDAEGRFEFPRVPAGPVLVCPTLGPWQDEGYRSAPHVPVDLQPGQRATLNLGSGGATLTGKLKLTGKVPAGLDCTYSLNYLVRRAPGVEPPAAIAKLGFDARNGWRDSWTQTPEGRTYFSTLRSWFVKLAADGSFRVSGVPPGEYDLAIAVYAKPTGCLVDPLARQVVRVTVADADITLPGVAAPVVPVPDVGDTPALSFERPDGGAGTLADCRGKFTVVRFWASWCLPCKKQLPALERVRKRFAARGLNLLSLALDDDAGAWRAAVTASHPPGAQGRLTAANAAGVSSVPAYWLLDPAGKIVARVYDPDELAAALDAGKK